MPGFHDGVAVAGAGQLSGVGEVGEHVACFGPQLVRFFQPGGQAIGFPLGEGVGAQAPEEAEPAGGVVRAAAHRQQADHLARGHVALAQLVHGQLPAGSWHHSAPHG